MLLHGCAVGERSSYGIWKHRTSSFKCYVDHSHILYSSGNIEVRNWVHLFESTCILSRGRLLLTQPRTFKLNIIGYLDLVTFIKYLARSLSFRNDIKRLVVYVRTPNRFPILYGVQGNWEIMKKDEVRSVSFLRRYDAVSLDNLSPAFRRNIVHSRSRVLRFPDLHKLLKIAAKCFFEKSGTDHTMKLSHITEQQSPQPYHQEKFRRSNPIWTMLAELVG